MSVVVDRLDAVKSAIRGVKDQSVKWEGDTNTPATDRTLVTSRTKLDFSGTITTLSLGIVDGTPNLDLYIRISLEDELQTFKGLICRGYVSTSQQPFGTGGLLVKKGDHIRVDTWGYVTCIVRPVASIIRDRLNAGGWTGTDEDNLANFKTRSITGTNPASGAEISETVPSGARWKLKSIVMSFGTSATVANREITLLINDGTNTLVRIPSGQTITASAGRVINYVAIGDTVNGSVAGLTAVPAPDVVLFAGWKITSSTNGLQAGDDFIAPQMLIEDKIEI